MEIGLKLVHKKPEQKICSHRCISVCEETRTIECVDCSVTMDAFEYLRHCCYDQDNALTLKLRYELEVEKLKKRYANLTKEIERLNAIKKILIKNEI